MKEFFDKKRNVRNQQLDNDVKENKLSFKLAELEKSKNKDRLMVELSDIKQDLKHDIKDIAWHKIGGRNDQMLVTFKDGHMAVIRIAEAFPIEIHTPENAAFNIKKFKEELDEEKNDILAKIEKRKTAIENLEKE